MDLNKAQLIGRVTQEIELKTTPNGQNVTNFSVATNRSWTDSTGAKQESAEFHNVVLWSKLAEIAGQYVKKGQKVFIEGRLQTRSWEGEDGKKRYTTEIVGENLIMLDSAGAKSTNSTQNTQKQETSSQNTNSDEEVSVEDIPF